MPGSARQRVCGYVLAIVAAIVALCPSVAAAATLTVGSPMTAGTPVAETHAGASTLANISLGEPGANVTSPVTGTIVRWRVATTGTGQYSLRVLRPIGSSQYIAVGTDAETVSTAGAQTFSTSLPMQAGDLLGVDIPANGVDGIAGVQAVGSNFAVWSPSVGSAPATPLNQANDGLELYLNADVDYTPAADGPPSPGPSPKKCGKKSEEKKKQKKHKRSGSATKSGCGKHKKSKKK
jgi:hypothetical protein